MIRDFDIEKWNSKPIVIYGAGHDGKIIANELNKHNITEFIICDSNKKGEYLLNMMISDPNILNESFYSNIILGSSKYYIDIYNILKRKGIEDKNIYTATKILSSNVDRLKTHDIKEIGTHYGCEVNSILLNNYINNGWHLGHLDIVITEICTLKCEACGSLMPLYKSPHNYSSDSVLEAFDNLLKSNCYITSINLIGGEPLVNQDLVQEILLRYKDTKQIGFFQMITNGTILPNEKTLKAMRENGRIYVIFSNYGKLSTKQNDAVKVLTESGIETAIIQEKDITESNNTLWIDYGEVKHYKFSAKKHQKMFDGCKDGKSCTTLMNGKLFICPRIAHAVNLGLIPENIPRCNVDLSKEAIKGMDWEDVKQKCVEFLSDIQYPPACEYCNRDAGILVERAKQIKS